MRLLVGDADHLSELLLRQPEHDPTFADARSDVIVDRRRGPTPLWLCHTTHPSVVLPVRPAPGLLPPSRSTRTTSGNSQPACIRIKIRLNGTADLRANAVSGSRSAQ